MNKNKQYMIVFILYVLFLALLPFLWWNSNLFLLGGDDIKLEYINPLFKLQNILSTDKIRSAWTESTLIHDFSNVPFLVLLLSIHLLFPYLNLQLLISSLIMSFGFLGFYWMCGALPGFNNANKISNFIRFTAANLYIFSTFTIYTLWSHQLYPYIYIGIVPFLVSLIIKSTTEYSLNKGILSSLIIAFSPSFYSNIPWLLPVFICGIPMISMVIVFSKIKNFLKTMILISIVSCALMFPTFLSISIFKSYTTGIFSLDSISNSIHVFQQVNLNNSIWNIFSLQPAQEFLYTETWMYKNMLQITKLIKVIMIEVFILLIALLMYSLRAKKQINLRKKITFLLGISVSYSFSVIGYMGGGKIVLSFLAGLMETFPLLIMFRNNYDKFSLSIALYSSIFIAYLLLIVYKNSNNLYKNLNPNK